MIALAQRVAMARAAFRCPASFDCFGLPGATELAGQRATPIALLIRESLGGPPPARWGGPPDMTRRFYPAAPAAAVWSRIVTARPTSATPKINTGAFVPGSNPQ